jgi:hypothetical protein
MSREAFEAMQPAFAMTTRADAIHFHRVSIEPLQQTHHLLGNFIPVVTSATAELSFHLRAHHQGAGAKAGLFEESLSHAKWSLVRTPGGWRVRRMDYVVYIVLGSMELFDTPEIRALSRG